MYDTEHMSRSHKHDHDIRIVEYFVKSGNRPASQTEIGREISCNPRTIRYQLCKDSRHDRSGSNTLCKRNLIEKRGNKYCLSRGPEEVIKIMWDYYFGYDRPWHDHESDLLRKQAFLKSRYADNLFNPTGFRHLATRVLFKWFLNLAPGIRNEIHNLLPPISERPSIWQEFGAMVEHAHNLDVLGEHRHCKDVSSDFEKEMGLLITAAWRVLDSTAAALLPRSQLGYWCLMEPPIYTMLSKCARLSPTFVTYITNDLNLADDASCFYDVGAMHFALSIKKMGKRDPVKARLEMLEIVGTQFTLYMLRMFQAFVSVDHATKGELIDDELVRRANIPGKMTSMRAVSDRISILITDIELGPRGNWQVGYLTTGDLLVSKRS
jgi:hypothetical protein